jgi:hypothetical protein
LTATDKREAFSSMNLIRFITGSNLSVCSCVFRNQNKAVGVRKAFSYFSKLLSTFHTLLSCLVGEIIRMEETQKNIKTKFTLILGTINRYLLMTLNLKAIECYKSVREDSRLKTDVSFRNNGRHGAVLSTYEIQ